MSRTLTITDIIVVSIGLVILFFWFILYITGRKHWRLFAGLDNEDYPLKELYFVGYALTDMLHFSYHTKNDRTTRKYLQILYGSKYVEYYVRAIYAQRVTMALTILTFGLPIYCFTQNILYVILIAAAAAAAYYYYGTTLPNKIQKRSDRMMSEFSEVVSKLALLVNAGMTSHEAWEDVAASGKGEIYSEMQASVENMRNGMAEIDAIYLFGQQCMVPQIKKFSSTLITSIKNGPEDLAQMLRQQSKEVWAEKQQIMRRQGEVANSKLLLPIMLTFVGVLIMVIVPIFSGMGM